ncbi:hypothetical protein HKX48_005256 [Thoreauomyces humboldtii]|nr:hypothetical protein HKX48_005256 [Thoreauomyces humboldtii]
MPHHHHPHESPRLTLLPSARPDTSAAGAHSPLARQYIADYVLTIAVTVFAACLDNFVEPFQREFSVDDLRISHKHRSETIPSSLGWVIAFGGPLVAFLLVWVVRIARRSAGERTSSAGWWTQSRALAWWDVHHAVLGVMLAVGLTQALTNSVKLMAGVLRPDFLDRCQPDTSVVPATCTSHDAGSLRDGRMSFPSGHSGRAGAGLGFALWYLVAATGAASLDRRSPAGRAWKLVVCMLPVFGILFVAINRLQRNRHHVPDVCVGSILGVLVSLLVYRYYYPSFTVHRELAGKPKVDDEIVPSAVHLPADEES